MEVGTVKRDLFTLCFLCPDPGPVLLWQFRNEGREGFWIDKTSSVEEDVEITQEFMTLEIL